MLSFQVRGLDGGRGLKSRIAGGRGVPAWWPGSKHEHLAPGRPGQGRSFLGFAVQNYSWMLYVFVMETSGSLSSAAWQGQL